jgi:hypothetical protein
LLEKIGVNGSRGRGIIFHNSLRNLRAGTKFGSL